MAQGILVALDGTSFAEQALPYGALLARRLHAPLLLARAVDFPGAPSGVSPVVRASAVADAGSYLLGLQRESAAAGLPAQALVASGSPAETLLHLAGEWDARLLVLATHARQGPLRQIVGSVAEEVLRHARLPILLLTPEMLDAGSPERLLRRLLLPLDGSQVGERAAQSFKALAQALDVPVTLVHALEPMPIGLGNSLDARSSTATLDVIRTARQATVARLRDLADSWQHEGLAADVEVEHGYARDVIAHVARQRQAGWVAMASHSHADPGGLVLGGTTQRVVRQASLPVLVAPLPKDAHSMVYDQRLACPDPIKPIGRDNRRVWHARQHGRGRVAPR